MFKFLCELLFSARLCKCQGAWMLDLARECIVRNIFLILWESTKLSLKVVVIFFISIINNEDLCCLTSMLYVRVSEFVHLNLCYLMLTHISWMTCDMYHNFICFSAICISSLGFPGGASSEEPTWCRLAPWFEKIPWGRKWQPTPVSYLENPEDREAWWATVHRVAKSQTRLNTHMYLLWCDVYWDLWPTFKITLLMLSFEFLSVVNNSSLSDVPFEKFPLSLWFVFSFS